MSETLIFAIAVQFEHYPKHVFSRDKQTQSFRLVWNGFHNTALNDSIPCKSSNITSKFVQVERHSCNQRAKETTSSLHDGFQYPTTASRNGPFDQSKAAGF